MGGLVVGSSRANEENGQGEVTQPKPQERNACFLPCKMTEVSTGRLDEKIITKGYRVSL